MYACQQEWVQLYEAVRDYEGAELFADLLAPWPGRHSDELRWLAEFARRPFDPKTPGASDEERCRLYAAHRTASLLLLRFQPPRRRGGEDPLPPFSVADFATFFRACGFHVPKEERFHPFYHEIVAVEQAPDPAEPIVVLQELWPALMLGDLMFVRAGCVVSGGTDHVVQRVAENSTLYWTFTRLDRPCQDLSYGWGNNSQWRTNLRRDFRSKAGFHYNVDARAPVEQAAADRQETTPVETLREAIVHRGLIRTAVADDSDLSVYGYRCFEPHRP